MSHKIKICSYNCNSLRNSIDIIRELLAENDILLLQETLIFSTDAEFISCIDDNFNFSISSCTRKLGIDSGRPIGGLITFWKKNLNSFLRPIVNSKNYIMMELYSENLNYILINCYLPCENRSFDSLIAFKEILGEISSKIDNYEMSRIVIMGEHSSRSWNLLE